MNTSLQQYTNKENGMDVSNMFHNSPSSSTLSSSPNKYDASIFSTSDSGASSVTDAPAGHPNHFTQVGGPLLPQRNAFSTQAQTFTDPNGYIDPRLLAENVLPGGRSPSNQPFLADDEQISNNSAFGTDRWTMMKGSNVHGPCQTGSLNDFDIAFGEMAPMAPKAGTGVRDWLDRCVAMNPDALQEIQAWLKERTVTQSGCKSEALDPHPHPDSESGGTSPYRPKCRTSGARYRSQRDLHEDTRLYKCTNRCGKSFKDKYLWMRHEWQNIEEWACHKCPATACRKDKLRDHLRDRHVSVDAIQDTQRRRLLNPRARPCGFCSKIFRSWNAWTNHVARHFEDRISGGPWTMAKWDRRVDPQFDLSESDHEGDEDDSSSDEYEDKNGHYDGSPGPGGGPSNAGNGSNSRGGPKDLGGSSEAFGASGGQSTSSYRTNIIASATHFGDANSGIQAGTIGGVGGVAYRCHQGSAMEHGGGGGGRGVTKTGATGPPSRPEELMNRFLSEPDDPCPWMNPSEPVLTSDDDDLGLFKPIDLDHSIRDYPLSDSGEQPMLSDFMSSFSLYTQSIGTGNLLRGIGGSSEDESTSSSGLSCYLSLGIEALPSSSMTSLSVSGARNCDIVHGMGFSRFLRLN